MKKSILGSGKFEMKLPVFATKSNLLLSASCGLRKTEMPNIVVKQTTAATQIFGEING